jgi:hypothetical protein
MLIKTELKSIFLIDIGRNDMIIPKKSIPLTMTTRQNYNANKNPKRKLTNSQNKEND